MDGSKLDEIPKFEPYDETRARSMLREIDSLVTFADVDGWDQRATREIQAINTYLSALSSAESVVNATELRVKDGHKEQWLLKRMFSTPNAVAVAATWRGQAAETRKNLSDLSEQLQAAIDKTPNSRAEQTEMLQELKRVKKQLALLKREANETMRQIRTKARQDSARVGTGLGAVFGSSTTRRISRMNIRLQKEAAVEGFEDSRTQIERQILTVDRTISWIEKFK